LERDALGVIPPLALLLRPPPPALIVTAGFFVKPLFCSTSTIDLVFPGLAAEVFATRLTTRDLAIIQPLYHSKDLRSSRSWHGLAEGVDQRGLEVEGVVVGWFWLEGMGGVERAGEAIGVVGDTEAGEWGVDGVERFAAVRAGDVEV
jgi:hypothetical protein